MGLEALERTLLYFTRFKRVKGRLCCVDARSCSLREAINMAAFEEHVSSLHADGDYLLSQEYEVQSFSYSYMFTTC